MRSCGRRSICSDEELADIMKAAAEAMAATDEADSSKD
jgi:hypothetical protein